MKEGFPASSQEQEQRKNNPSEDEHKKEEVHEDPEHNKKEGFKVFVADAVDYIKSKSRDVALERMTEHRDSLEGFKGFLTRAWKHNLFRDYYLFKETRKAEQELKEEDFPQAIAEIIEKQFLSEYEEAIHEEAGEKRRVFNSTEEEKQLSNAVKNLIREYAMGEIEESEFREEQGRLFRDIFGLERGAYNDCLVPVDNALDLARHLKSSIEHQKALNALDEDFELIVGEARPGVRTEADFGPVDRVVDKLKEKKLGRMVNEATLATGASIAYSLAGFASRSFAHNKLAQVASFGSTAFIAGGLAAARENVQQKRERTLHVRQRAQGKTAENEDEEQERRKEMDEFVYETAKAPDAIEALRGAKDYTENLEELTKEDFEKIVHPLALAEALVAFSDREKVDLVSYSHEESVDKERLEMDVARAEAKIVLKKALENSADKSFLGEGDLEDYLESAKNTIIEQNIKPEIKKKNELFNKYKKKKVAEAALKGTLTGAVIGGIAQEVTSLVRGDQQGVVEGVKGETPREDATVTPLEALRNYVAPPGTETVTETETVPTFEHQELEYNPRNIFEAESSKYRLPEGFEFTTAEDGTLTLLRDGEHMLKGLEIDEDGLLTDDAIEDMRRHDFETEIETRVVEEAAEEKTVERVITTQEFINENIEEFQPVTRDLWYDNDTPHIATHNELRLHWGAEGAGIDDDGNFVYDVSRMTADGSVHRGFSIDAQEAMQEGRLKLLLSMSADTQQLTFDVPIDANGHAVIDPESGIAKHLFEERNGQAVFKGRFAEVAEVVDTLEDGTEVIRPLATAEGDGIREIVVEEKVAEVEEAEKHDIYIDYSEWIDAEIEIEMEREVTAPKEFYNVEAPPIVPFFGRYPLEPLVNSERDKRAAAEEGEEAFTLPPVAKTYFETYFSASDPELKKFFAERRSEALDDPETKLNHRKEESDYFVRQKEGWMDSIEELNDQIKEPMNPECKLAVCIPVAGHQESDNIYNTLEKYTNQKTNDGEPLDTANFEIILFVNNPENYSSEDTLQEIEKFKKDYPYMPVRVMHKTLEKEETKMGAIRKYLTDVALFRNHERGADSPDLIVVSNDADCENLSDTYVENYIKQFENNPDIEGMLGKLDWDPEAYVKSPLLHAGTRFFQVLDILARHPQEEGEGKKIASSGANFAFRGSIYAAIGGYIEDDEVAEDKRLGQMIADAREGQGYPLDYAGPKSALYTNARRAVDAMKRGKAPAEQWEEGVGSNDLLREGKWQIEDVDIEEIVQDAEMQEEFAKDLSRIINRTIELYGLEPNSEDVERALEFMGVGYEIKEGQVEITDASKYMDDFRYYKQKYEEKMADQKQEAQESAPQEGGPENEEAIIRSAESFEDLYSGLRDIGTIEGYKGKTYDAEILIENIEKIREREKETGKRTNRMILPEAHNLRWKVVDLLQKESGKEPDDHVGDSVESAEEYERTFTFADFLIPHESKQELSEEEKEQEIQNAKNLGELVQAVYRIGGVKRKEEYGGEIVTGKELENWIENDLRLIKENKDRINLKIFPEKYGLRNKVVELLNDEAEELQQDEQEDAKDIESPEQETEKEQEIIRFQGDLTALSYSKPGHVIEWDKHKYARNVEIPGHDNRVIIETNSGNRYIVGSGKVAEEKSGRVYDIEELGGELPNIAIGRKWGSPRFFETTRVKRVMLKYKLFDENDSRVDENIDNPNPFDELEYLLEEK